MVVHVRWLLRIEVAQLEVNHPARVDAQNPFESGLLSQAESVLKVAESAYKYGERGILEYLDAQRTYRVVKKDYLTARFDYVATMIEVERLVGTQLVGSD